MIYWIFKYKPHLTGIPSEIGVWVPPPLYPFGSFGREGVREERASKLHSLFYYEKKKGRKKLHIAVRHNCFWQVFLKLLMK